MEIVSDGLERRLHLPPLNQKEILQKQQEAYKNKILKGSNKKRKYLKNQQDFDTADDM